MGCRPPAFTGGPWQQKVSSAGAQQNMVPSQTRDSEILNTFLKAPSASLHPTLPRQSAAATAQQVITDVAHMSAQQNRLLPPATCRSVHPAIHTQKAKAPSGAVIESVALLFCSRMLFDITNHCMPCPAKQCGYVGLTVTCSPGQCRRCDKHWPCAMFTESHLL